MSGSDSLSLTGSFGQRRNFSVSAGASLGLAPQVRPAGAGRLPKNPSPALAQLLTEEAMRRAGFNPVSNANASEIERSVGGMSMLPGGALTNSNSNSNMLSTSRLLMGP